jgi:hydroxyacylglutathione hydrolase
MLNIERFVFNSFMVNTYVVYDETKEAVIIDAACYTEKEKNALAEFIEGKGLKVVHHLDTHCHIDHILGGAFVEEKYGIRPEYHQSSVPFFKTVREIAATFGYDVKAIPEPLRFLEEGDTIPFGKHELSVLYTPGHADGHVCFYEPTEKVLFTGDVLFRDTIGRTDLPSGNFDLLMESIKGKLFTLPDEVTVYPGHGPETTLGYEKINNPFIR